ncbi:MAG: dienelactone hydrolase family protein [Leptolyngbyaceae cyanobacterium bins.302]|nr:dienelactone hydrolase family protein [Leptolyngbyaceae cyanobacterium bins.302]
MKVILSLVVAPIAMVLAPVSAFAALKTQLVEYKQGDTVLEGYLAYDDAITTKRPAVMVVHAWMGVDDYVKKRAEQLAQMGYVAFAADIYGKGIRPDNPKDAGAQAGIYRENRQLMRDRARAGLAVLQNNPQVDAKRIAAIGYCFGGGVVLELARSGAPVAGVVSFHGNLDTPNPADAKNIKGKVLVLHGAIDPLVPAAQVDAFEKEMNNANVDWQLVSYGGAVHSFTMPKAGSDKSKGAAYDATADRRSFAAMKQFFEEIFGRSTSLFPQQPARVTNPRPLFPPPGGRRRVVPNIR